MVTMSHRALRYLQLLNSEAGRLCEAKLHSRPTLRAFSASPATSSGHNKWSKIKHDKGRNDASRASVNSDLAREIADASKASGADLAFNPRLNSAVTQAKKSGLAKTTIENAIARGQGKSVSGAPLEALTIEAVVPPVALIVECQTDSKKRAMGDLRLLLKKHGGSATPTSYLFEKRGRVVFEAKDGIGVDEVLETALEAGAVDVWEDEEGRVVLDTEANMIKEAETAVAQAAGLSVRSSEAIWYPNEDTRVEHVQGRVMEDLDKLQDALEEYPGVQGVYTNLDLVDSTVDTQNPPT